MTKPINITIDAIKVNNSDHLGAISFGATAKIGRHVYAKKNQGFGQQFADGVFRVSNVHYVLDDDQSDSERVMGGE